MPSQLVFEHGESPEQIRRSIERNNPGTRVLQIVDTDLKVVYPVEEPADQTRRRQLKKGEFDRKPMNFKFDRIVVVFLRPGDPQINSVYHIQTFL